MDLFNPESGLVIWMLVVFLLVLFVLAKFAFPVISKSLSEREQRINNALKVADEAEAKLAHVEEERKKILAEAKEAQQEAINEVKAQKKQWLETARAEAQAEANKIVAEAMEAVEAISGLRLVPDYTFDSIPDDYAALVLIGGYG